MTNQSAHTLDEIRVAQATALKQDARRSALLVWGLVIYIAIILLASGNPFMAFLWVMGTSVMIVVTLIYARFVAPNGITKENFRFYLRGHVIICILTGTLWTSFAIVITDFQSAFSLLIAGSIVTSITAGGMLPGSAYRPAYIALAIPTLLPLSFYWIIFAPNYIRFFGLALILYFMFGLMSSAQAEILSRDGIIAKIQQRLSAEMAEKTRAVRLAYAEKSRFLASTSHDLSQPLHAQGYFLDALSRSVTSSEQGELVEKIKASWTAQKDMLESLVTVTRAEGGMLRPNPTRFDLSELVESILREQEASNVNKDLRLTCQIEGSVTLISDVSMARRIIANALSNAVKHGKGSDVSVSLQSDDDKAILVVRDGGPGFVIDGNVLNEDDGVVSTQTVRSGLGLSIIRSLSNLVGADVFIGNRTEASGAKCMITLKNYPTLPTSQTPLGQSQSTNAVLVIDDDRAILDALSSTLSFWGLQVVTAESLEIGLSRLTVTGFNPDLLIVDNRLDGVSTGAAVIRSVRDHLAKDIPVIVMSGDIGLPTSVSDQGNVRILPKPVMPDQLRQLIFG